MRAALLAAALLALCLDASAANPTSPGLDNGRRGDAALDTEPTPPRTPRWINDDQRKARNYPSQPPIIPHHIDNYQIDKNFNKCLSCHARDKVAESLAPPVGASHYATRDGKVLAHISPRRYFCIQCHVPQTDARVPVKNNFNEYYEIADTPAKGSPKK